MRSTHRQNVIVNLDPANEDLPYECAIDIAELVDLQKVMEEENLGPNGGGWARTRVTNTGN